MTSINDATFIPLEVPEKYTYGTFVDDAGRTIEWQKEDVEYLAKRTFSANWSEMGCYKTTTLLWTIDKKVREACETTRMCPHGHGKLTWTDDMYICLTCGDEWSSDVSPIVPIILIVTSKSGKGTYFDAIPKCLSGYRVYDVTGTTVVERDAGFEFKLDPDEWIAAMQNPKDPTIILSHYNTFENRSKMLPRLKSLGYAFIALDEAHRIKEKDNQWTRNLKELGTWTGFKHVMTGTGFINRPDEIWSLLNFLDPKTYSSYWEFRRVFCDEMKLDNGFIQIFGVKENMRETFRDMRKLMGPRREMVEVHRDIAKPVFTPLLVELNPTQRRMYKEIKLGLKALDQAGEPLYSPNVLSQLSRLRQICVATPKVVADYWDEDKERRVQEVLLEEPSSKLDMLMELLETLEWNDERRQQTVVFSNFKGPLELLKVRLEKADIPFIWMKESHNDTQRYELWHDVWPTKQHQVFMCTLQLGSESINLSSAQHCVFLDRSWSPKDNNQGVSRIWRPGQKDVAQIIHINAVNTTDQKIERRLEIKQSWFDDIFSNED